MRSNATRPTSVRPAGSRRVPTTTALRLERLGSDEASDFPPPGGYPFTRGFHPEGFRERFWAWEMYAGFGAAEDANRRYRFLLENGPPAGSRWRSTCRPRSATTATTQWPRARSARSASRSTRSPTSRGCSMASTSRTRATSSPRQLHRADHRTRGCSTCSSATGSTPRLPAADPERPDQGVLRPRDPVPAHRGRGPAGHRHGRPLPRADRAGCRSGLGLAHEAGRRPRRRRPPSRSPTRSPTWRTSRKGALARRPQPTMELHFCTDMDFFEEVAKYRAVRRAWTELVRERFGVAPTDATCRSASTPRPPACR